MRLRLATILAIGSAGLAVSAPAYAAEHRFDIRAGKLAAALDEFVRQSGEQVLYRPDHVEGRTTAGVRGVRSTKSALKILLAKSDLAVWDDPSGAIAVVRRAPVQPSATVPPRSAAAPVVDAVRPSPPPSLDMAVVEDIIVTATRKSESSQRVAISMTAVGSEQLSREGVTSAEQLPQLAPSLYVTAGVSEGSPRYSLRGVTGSDTFATAAPAVATYIDDVYQSFQYGIASALFDIGRVEILRGPQGTTFGRNTTGGAVAYFSQLPTNRAEGYVSGRLGGGDQSQVFVEGAINQPLGDTLAMRVSGRFENKGGWARNLSTGQKLGGGDGQFGRVQLRWTPSSDTSANLVVFAGRRRGDVPPSKGVFVGEPVDRRTVSLSDFDYYDDYDNRGVTLKIDHQIGEISLASITHYRWSRYATAQDVDARADDAFFPLLYIDTTKAEQYGQELRLASDATKPLSGILGAYFEKDTLDSVNNEGSIANFNFNNVYFARNTITNYAVFGNLTFRISDTLSVTGGLRKTFEKLRVNGIKRFYLSGSVPFTAADFSGDGRLPAVAPDDTLVYGLSQAPKPWTWDATVNYSPSRSTLMFVRIARGFRSGGFNPPPSLFNPAELPASDPVPFFPETLRSYEAGLKMDVIPNRLRVNASLFHYDFANQQVQVYPAFVPFKTNAGKAKVDGGEIEIVASPSRALDVRLSVAYADARFTDYVESPTQDNSGNPLFGAPKLTGNASVSYTTPLSADLNLRATTAWSYRSRVYFDPRKDPEASDPRLLSGNLRIGAEASGDSGVSIFAFVNNITNQRRLIYANAFAQNIYYNKYYSPGRTFGLDLSYKW